MTDDRATRGEADHSALPKLTSIEWVLALGGLALFFTLLYATETLLSPFVLMLAMLVIMFPLRRYPVARNITGFSALIFVLWFVKTIEIVLAPFFVALVLSYLLHPVVTRVEEWNVPRWASALIIIICACAIVVLLLMGAVPMIAQQFGAVVQTFNSISSQFTNWLMSGSLFRTLRRYGVSSGQLHEFLSGTLSPRVEDILKGILQGASGVVSKFETILTGIINIVIIPFLTFFILRDFPLVKHRIKMLVPSERREEAIVYYQYVDDIVGRYLRGALVIACFDSVMVSVLFWAIGFPYAMVIGLMSGMLTFIPYFGMLTMLVITSVVASLSPEDALLHLLLGVGVVLSMHVIETYVLAPKIIGSKIGLHPVLLILSLLVFGYFLGFLGLLIAIPAAGSIVVIAKEWEKRRKESTKDNPLDIMPR